jgi:hypothetical protein
MNQFARADIVLVMAATALLAMDGVSKAWNWQHLLSVNVGGPHVSFRRVLAWFFAGGFIGAIVPSSASTDACRVVLATRGVGGHAAECAASIFSLNALGWFAGCVIGVVGLGLLAADRSLPTALESLAVVFGITLIALPIAYGALSAKRARMIELIKRSGARWPSIRAAITKFLGALLVFQRARVWLPASLLIATLGLLAQTGMFAVTARAVDVHLPFAVWMMLVPLTRIVALVPISVADFGLIQAAHMSVLDLFGVPPWQSFALSTLFAIEGLIIHSTLGSSTFLLGALGGPAPAALRGDAASSCRRRSRQRTAR